MFVAFAFTAVMVMTGLVTSGTVAYRRLWRFRREAADSGTTEPIRTQHAAAEAEAETQPEPDPAPNETPALPAPVLPQTTATVTARMANS